jgi:hypothetical protein
MQTLKCFPNTCLLFAVAMVLNVPVMEIQEWAFGNPQQVFGQGKRGHIMEDFQIPMAAQGHGFVKYTVDPATREGSPYYDPATREQRLDWLFDIMNGHVGILTGFMEAGLPHAMAWDGQRFHDPFSGTEFTPEEIPFRFNIQEFYMYVKFG